MPKHHVMYNINSNNLFGLESADDFNSSKPSSINNFINTATDLTTHFSADWMFYKAL